MWLDGTVRTETADVMSIEGPTTNRDAKQEEDSNVLGAFGRGLRMQRVGIAVLTEQVVNVSDPPNGDGKERLVLHLKSVQVVVDREK